MRVIKAASRTGFRVLLLLMLLLPFSRCLAAAPPPLLKATVYTELASLDGYWVSEKLDGVRAYWDGRQLRSRQGNVYQAPDWFTENLPQQPLDG